MDVETPVFAIAMAAELAGMHPQTLRQYDRLGLVSPTRTAGQSRRYSMRDVAQLREIAALSAEGLNLEGIRRILDLENQVTELTERVRELEHALADELLSRPGRRAMSCLSRRVPAPSVRTRSWSGAPCVAARALRIISTDPRQICYFRERWRIRTFAPLVETRSSWTAFRPPV